MSKAEKTRDYIIEKAAPLFNKKGYAGTSLNDLIEVTGLTKGAIYGNFGNKDEVALAAYDHNAGRIMDHINERMAAKSNAIDKLYAITEFYRSNYKQAMSTGGCPIMNTAAEADDSHPQLREKAANSFKAWRKSIETVIKKGIGKGEVKKHADASEYAVIIIALIEGGMIMSKAAEDKSLLFTCLDQVDSLIRKKLAP